MLTFFDFIITFRIMVESPLCMHSNYAIKTTSDNPTETQHGGKGRLGRQMITEEELHHATSSEIKMTRSSVPVKQTTGVIKGIKYAIFIDGGTNAHQLQDVLILWHHTEF